MNGSNFLEYSQILYLKISPLRGYVKKSTPKIDVRIPPKNPRTTSRIERFSPISGSEATFVYFLFLHRKTIFLDGQLDL